MNCGGRVSGTERQNRARQKVEVSHERYAKRKMALCESGVLAGAGPASFIEPCEGGYTSLLVWVLDEEGLYASSAAPDYGIWRD